VPNFWFKSGSNRLINNLRRENYDGFRKRNDGKFYGFGLLGWLINIIIIGAVVYIAVKLALKGK